jgi:hypothetical protein
MSQKSSVPQAAKFVSQALKRDTADMILAGAVADSDNDDRRQRFNTRRDNVGIGRPAEGTVGA